MISSYSPVKTADEIEIAERIVISDETRYNAEILWEFQNITVDDPVEADAIIGLGSYSIAVADKCAELYFQKTSQLILFSGSQGNWTRDLWEDTEAERFRDRAHSLGVNPSHILMDTTSTNIGENLRNARAICEQYLPKTKNIIVVTKPNTSLRAKLTAEVVWPEASLQCCSPSVHWTEQAAPPMSVHDVVAEMVGDIHRIQHYPRRGFQSYAILPEKVKHAFHYLVTAGYGSHLLQGAPLE